MVDLEKVIKAMECCTQKNRCRECPYGRTDTDPEGCVRDYMLPDALELLKAKEPKPPIVKENAYGWKFFYCPSCGREFNANRKHGRVNEENFCDKCGQAVKWDG